MKYVFEINGEKKSLVELCRISGKDYSSAVKSLKSGHSIERTLSRTHGHSRNKKRTKTYSIWLSMKKRCHSKNNSSYKDYGAKGIKVCDRWLYRFDHFLTDMGEAPPGRQIDRINNKKGYEKENCRWVTPSDNSRNRTTTRWITYRGLTLNLSEWAFATGINYRTLKGRIDYLGWDLEDAFKKKDRGY